MLKKINNDKGITLVELLATLVIVSIIGALSYSILFQGYSNYQRIQAETQLRDEADLIMASFIKEVFVFKKSNIASGVTCTENNTNLNSYIELKDPPTPRPSGNTEPYVYGFVGDRVKVGWNYLQFSNPNITLLTSKCEKGNEEENYITTISESKGELSYTIKFSLKTKKGNNDYTMQFENTVQIVDDTEVKVDE